MSDGTHTSNRASRTRGAGVLGTAWAAVMGVLPHVLHHAGPLAGAALVSGVAGTLLFGAATLVLTIPLVLRVHRRTGSWRAPLGLLVLFVAMWALSTVVVGPAVRDRLEQRRTNEPEHASKHEQHEQDGR